ncbi:uncharacterized protein C8Q71DRAFT_773908 [Rhodofomes roseus]|uniref:F-box domain-containing protein n=1 Tax=Rhodofomes roseus TaxID=34475 RepID=A0ABQ8K8B9_9APHY|nr:uncharacterized protein C8Q71DRAFT_773908 [Rhodofomes roseus]KAH9833537.1 hypothetical protein C8Q71DRAFT_773908 [Rhodofomes roseus]
MPPKPSKQSRSSTSTNGVAPKAATVARWKNVRGRRGGLKDMLNMPMDIIREICLRLHPRDLLSLSRTSKSFNSFLMRRSSAYLWRGSLRNVEGLPPCPSGLIEPSWVSLVFSPYCTGCMVRTAPTIYWEFRVRSCATCRSDMFISQDRVTESLNGKQFGYYSRLPQNIYLKEEVAGFKKPCYLKSQIFEILDRCRVLSESGKWEEDRAALVETYVAEAEAASEHAALCQTWAHNEECARRQEANTLMRQRLEDIIPRIRALGWGPELDFIQARDYAPLSQHKLVKSTKKLTDRAWQKIQGELMLCMDGIREDRLANEIQNTLTERWTVLNRYGAALLERYFRKHPELQQYGLNVADLALCKEFRDVMTAPADVVIDETNVLALEGQIGAIVDRWQEGVREQLSEVLAKHKFERNGGTDPLDLATTIFHVGEYPRYAWFPTIVADRGLRNPTPEAGRDWYEKFVYGQKVARCFVGCDMLCLVQPTDRMREIIQVCGKDPSAATAEDIDALNVQLVSDTSPEPTTWRDAMLDAAKDGSQRWWLESRGAESQFVFPTLKAEDPWLCDTWSDTNVRGSDTLLQQLLSQER